MGRERRVPGDQRGLHSFRHLLLVQGARVEAVVECTNPCTEFMRAGCDVAGSAGAARVRWLFGCSTYANDRAAFKGLVPTCPALAPEVDRLDGTLLLRRSQQRVERRSRAIWYCPIAGERARKIRPSDEWIETMRAPKAIRQPSVAHGRSDVLVGARDLFARVSAVSRQRQSHESLLPHLVHATAHFGVHVPNRLLFVGRLYDIGIALSPRILEQTFPGHEGGREDPAGIVDVRASAHAHGGGRRRHARAGGCALKFGRVCAADMAQACVGARSMLFRRIQHLGSVSVATRTCLGTVWIKHALLVLRRGRRFLIARSDSSDYFAMYVLISQTSYGM